MNTIKNKFSVLLIASILGQSSIGAMNISEEYSSPENVLQRIHFNLLLGGVLDATLDGRLQLSYRHTNNLEIGIFAASSYSDGGDVRAVRDVEKIRSAIGLPEDITSATIGEIYYDGAGIFVGYNQTLKSKIELNYLYGIALIVGKNGIGYRANNKWYGPKQNTRFNPSFIAVGITFPTERRISFGIDLTCNMILYRGGNLVDSSFLVPHLVVNFF